MIGWILTAMSVDLIYQHKKQLSEKELSKKKHNLQRRLSFPMTRGHTRNCKCNLCHNRREKAALELSAL